MPRVAWAGGVLVMLVASTPYAAAQAPGKPATGNPTPGTEQPAPPNLADRMTFSGCLRPAPANGAGRSTGASTAAIDPNEPSDARFVLTNAERQDRVPPGTGGSAATAAATGRTYRLEGIDSQLSPFVGTKVEISGEIKPLPAGSAGAAGNSPALLVEFVQKIAASCS
ncbi:MAG TPA: hypothetical protein VI485_23855 [Vicinamibacterales bacterium]|nr:hypothetical protein [Vicinamibacterales bacterium]